MQIRIWPMALALLLLTSHAVGAQSQDERAIKDVFNAYVEDWNTPGFPGLETLLTPDVDFVVVTGKWLRGRGDVAAYHRELLKNFYAGSRLTIEDVEVRLIDGSHAVVHVASAVNYTQKGEVVHRPSLATATLLKSPDGWKIDTFHNTITGGPGYMFGAAATAAAKK